MESKYEFKKGGFVPKQDQPFDASSFFNGKQEQIIDFKSHAERIEKILDDIENDRIKKYSFKSSINKLI